MLFRCDKGKAVLTEFRAKIEAKRHAKYWTSGKELAGMVALGLPSVMKIKPRVGWIRANLARDEGAAEEILRLRDRIVELDGMLKASVPPSESEDLAQGDDAVTLSFRAEHMGKRQTFTEGWTWNQVFAVVGPVVLNGATEQTMKNQLGAVFKRSHDLYDSYLVDGDFQIIKIQLRALGLIDLSPQRPGGYATWVLTPYGDAVLTKVAAIRRAKTV